MEIKDENNEQKQALVPLEERSVDFYGDEVIAVLALLVEATSFMSSHS